MKVAENQTTFPGQVSDSQCDENLKHALQQKLSFDLRERKGHHYGCWPGGGEWGSHD